jgi:hypothetical protein
MRADEIEQAVAPYTVLGADPVPAGNEPKLPLPNWRRAAHHDPGFPLAGSASVVLLVREDGGVDRVLVVCASSAKLVEPIVATFSNTKVGGATRGGVPVRSTVVVPVRY